MLTAQEIEARHGEGGYWCQGDAVWIAAKHPAIAVTIYRQKLAQGEIAISAHLPCVDAFAVKRCQEEVAALKAIVTLVRSIQNKQAEWQKLFSDRVGSDQWNHEIEAIRQEIEASQKQLNEALNAVIG